jgi:predicted RNase H-like nuclease
VECASLPGMPLVAGVDGRRGGWSVALVTMPDDAGAGAGAVDGMSGGARGGGADAVDGVRWVDVPGQDRDGFVRVLELATEAVAVGVDCPVGLPRDAWRPCDLAAKRRLGPASARVFLTPPRAVLAAVPYAAARAVARELLDGRSVSAQTYGLRRIVLAVDEVLRRRERSRGEEPPVCEVHPELSFMALAGRVPGDPLPSKRTSAGRAARTAALAGWVPDVARLAPPGDDGLDALAVAWSAWRWSRGSAEVLGGELDEFALPMRMVI